MTIDYFTTNLYNFKVPILPLFTTLRHFKHKTTLDNIRTISTTSLTTIHALSSFLFNALLTYSGNMVQRDERQLGDNVSVQGLTGRGRPGVSTMYLNMSICVSASSAA